MGLELATMALISGGLQVASGVMGYVEQRKADKAAKKAAYQEAAIMEADAAENARQERIAAKEHRAQQKVLYLASGVDLSGSPLLQLQKTARQGEYNADNIISSAASRASITRKQGSIGRASLLGSIADTAGSAMGSYYNYKTASKVLAPPKASILPKSAVGSAGGVFKL